MLPTGPNGDNNRDAKTKIVDPFQYQPLLAPVEANSALETSLQYNKFVSNPEELKDKLRNLRDARGFDYEWTHDNSTLEHFSKVLADILPQEINPALFLLTAESLISGLANSYEYLRELIKGELATKLFGMSDVQYGLLRGHLGALARYAGPSNFAAAVESLLQIGHSTNITTPGVKRNDIEISRLLSIDPCAEAERFTGQSADGRDCLPLSLALNAKHVQTLKEAFKTTKDTYYAIKFSEFEEVVKSLGFIEIYRENCSFTYMCQVRNEKYCIYYRGDGLVLTVETYLGESVNMSTLYANWRSSDDPDAHQALVGCSYGYSETNTYDISFDAREGLAHKLRTLERRGEFLPKWINRPFLWFVQYNETKDEGYNHKAITAARISQLPRHVQDFMMPRKDFISAQIEDLSLVGFKEVGKVDFDYFSSSGNFQEFCEAQALWNDQGMLLIRTKPKGTRQVKSWSEGEPFDSSLKPESCTEWKYAMLYCNWRPHNNEDRYIRAFAGSNARVDDNGIVLVSVPLQNALNYHIEELQRRGVVVANWTRRPAELDSVLESKIESGLEPHKSSARIAACAKLFSLLPAEIREMISKAEV